MDIESLLKDIFAAGKTLFLCVGSELREDDGAGMYIAERISAIRKAEVCVIAGGTAPENFTGLIRRFAPKSIVVIDAAHMGLYAGEYMQLMPDDISGDSFSTHMLPLPIMLHYLEADCDCTTCYIGIQPEKTGYGLGLSESVRAGADRLSEIIIRIANEFAQ